jgi:hypothetical protein
MGLRGFFDDNGVDSEGFGVEGVLELEAEELLKGEEGEADAVAEGAVPGDGRRRGRICTADGGALLL